MAQWLKGSGCRDKLVITSKACHHYVDENNVHHAEKSRVRPEHITEDLHYSLDDLHVDNFEIYLMHRDDETQPVEGLIDRLEQHRREGLIKAYGVSNWSLSRFAEAQAYAQKMGYQGLSVNSPSYSMAKIVNPRFVGCVYADDDYMAWHRDKDILVLAWAPLAVGFFAGIYKQDGSAPPDIVNAYFCDENFARLERAKELAAKKGLEPILISLAYVLNQPLRIAAAVGPRNADELRSLVRGAELELSEDEVRWPKQGIGKENA